MYKLYYLAVFVMFFTGCTHSPRYTITSSQPAYIEIDGVIVCEKTPCTVTPPYHGDAVLCDDIHPVQSQLSAFPIDKANGYVQQKSIKAKCGDEKTVFFDMNAAGGIRTITAQ